MSTTRTYSAVYWKNDRFGMERYRICDNSTGEVLDDCHGYGYKSKKAAYSAYGYLNRDKDLDEEHRQHQLLIQNWCREHPEFMEILDEEAFGHLIYSKPMDAKRVRFLLELHGYRNLPFTPFQLLKVWEKLPD